MAVDTTGIPTAVAQIPKGQLSERQQRIAAGLVAVKNGASISAAARAAQIPRSTLHDYVNGTSTLGNARDTMERATVEVAEHAIDISRIAAESVKDSLANEPEAWRPTDLVKAFGVASSTVIQFSQRQAPTDTGISALATLLESSDVTISKRDPATDAVDVTPEKTETESDTVSDCGECQGVCTQHFSSPTRDPSRFSLIPALSSVSDAEYALGLPFRL